MADSPRSTPTESVNRVRTKLLEWTANNVVGWLLTSLVAGGSAAYVMSQAEIQKIGDELEGIISGYEKRTKDRIDELGSTQEKIIKSIQNTKHEISGVREVALQISYETEGITSGLDATDYQLRRVVNQITSNHEEAREHFENSDSKSNEIFSQARIR